MKNFILSAARRDLALTIAIALLVALAPRPAFSQVYPTWQGTGTNWSDPANWSPAYAYDQLQWTGSGNTTSFNDIGGAAQWRFYFSGGTTYNLSGSNVTFYDFSGNRGGILSDSTVVQNIGMDLTFQDSGRPTFILARNTGGLTFSNILVTTNTTALGIGGFSNNSTIRFNGTISGTNSIVIGTNSFDLATTGMGATRAVFAGSNTYDGQTTVNLGALFVANNNALGSTSTGTTVNAGGSLILSNGVTISGETLTLNGLGSSDFASGTLVTFTGSGSNNYAGNININAGEVRIQAYGGTTLALSGTLTSATNRSLYIGGNGTTIISNALSGFNNNSGNGALFKDFDGNLILLGDNSTGLTGTFQHRQGVVTITNANSLGSGRFELGRSGYTGTTTLQVNATTARTADMAIGDGATNGVINVTNNQIFTLNANLSNTGGGSSNTTKFGKAGAGTLVLGGTGSTYAGQIQIGDGTVVLASSSALGTNVTTGTTRAIDLGLNVGDTNQANNVAILAGNGVTVSNSIYVAANTNSATRTVGVSGSGSATFNNEIYLDGTLTADSGASGNNLTFNGNLINTNGGLIKAGAGTATLAGTNTYTGTTTVNAGTLALTNGAAIADTVAVTLSNNAGAVLAVNTSETIGSLSGGGASGGNVSLNGSGVTLTVADTTSQTFSGVISGTGALTKTGTSVLTLAGSAANTYSGATTINAGTLQLQKTAGVNAIAGNITVGDATGGDTLQLMANDQIADTSVVTLVGTVVNNRGGFRLNGFNETIGGLSGDGFVEISSVASGTNNNVLTLSNAAATTQTYSGLIRNGSSWTGTLSLTKTGSGTQVLATNNTYTGATTIKAGTLQLGNGGAFGSLSTSSTITNDGTLVINRSDSVAQGTIFANGISGTGSLVQAGAGTLTLSASNSYSGGTVVSAGQLNINNASAIGTGTLTFSNLAKFDNTSAGAISNANNNAVVFGNTNTFSSTQALNMGTGDVTLASGGTRLTVSGTGALTLGGNISGSAVFNKDGIGTLTLAGSNAFTSYTVIDYGILNLANTNAMANAQLYLYGSGANKMVTFGLGGTNTYNLGALSGATNGVLTLGANSVNVGAANITTTYSGVIEGTGAMIKSGTGTLTLTGNSSYAGGTSLNAGTLRLNSTTAAGTGTITQADGTSLLEINTTGTVTNAMSIYKISTLQSVTLSGNKTLNNATYTVASGTITTDSGNLSGTGGVTKQGTGTLILTGDNSYTGAVAVNEGLLNLNSSTGGAAATTSSVSVASGATLLVSQSNQVNNSAAVTLSGGTIQRASGVTEVFGNLIVSSASFLDFGTGTAGTISFGTYAPSSLLTVQNFFPGNVLTFGSNLTNTINNPSLFSFSGGFTSSWNSGTSTFTITAVPETSTVVAALGLLGLCLWPMRRYIVRIHPRGIN